jgi:uncharacterized repeat protein (TIGR01451 family)
VPKRGGGIYIKNIIVILLLLAMIFTSEATLVSEFKCNANDSTLIFYNRLKEPSLQDSGYTRGLKTGSINYLVNGNMTFKDKVTYYYGMTNDSNIFIDYENTSVTHEQKVDFRGEKGISEFYAKGFFKNNRAISAWKKVRYDDLSSIPGPYGLGETYLSPNITTDAYAKMNRRPGLDYTFRYHAIVDKGVLEIWDSTGWTNKSGSKRIDWEQTALIKGNRLDVVNNLADFDLKAPALGENDWLPCCYSGTKPAIESLDSGWPSDGTFMTLQPGIILPNNYTLKCSPGYCEKTSVEGTQSMKCTPGKCIAEMIPGKSVECSSGNCPGFECIYTSQQGVTPWAQQLNAPALSEAYTNYGVTKISVDKAAINISEDLVTYKINVKNVGDTAIFNVRLTDTLPEGMVMGKFDEVDSDGNVIKSENRSISVVESKERSTTLAMGDFKKDDSKWLLMEARINSDAMNRNPNIYLDNQVLATGDYRGNRVESTASAILRPETNGTLKSGESFP